MKRLFLALFFISAVQLLSAQEDSSGRERGFKKENLFAGGTVSLGFGSNYFQIGANPMFGYSLNRFVDAGLVVNYLHTAYRDYSFSVERLRQNLYGGGAFVRAYPVRFLFAHGQIEHNFIALKAIPYNGGAAEKYNESATSFLVGPGYTTGRQPGAGGAYGYLSVMWDLMDDENSPYVDNVGRKIPVIRGGIIVPLFQGKDRDW
jgi:hypothetical protein